MQIKLRFALLLAGLAIGCTDEGQARRVLKAQGYKDIQTTGHAWFGCGKGDSVATGFRATSPGGETVEGAVCCGLMLKNCTVRLDL